VKPISFSTKVHKLSLLSGCLGHNTAKLPPVNLGWGKGTAALKAVLHAKEVCENKGAEAGLRKIFVSPDECPRMIKTEAADVGHVFPYTDMLAAARRTHDDTSQLVVDVLKEAKATGLAAVTAEERGRLLIATVLSLQTAIPNIRGKALASKLRYLTTEPAQTTTDGAPGTIETTVVLASGRVTINVEVDKVSQRSQAATGEAYGALRIELNPLTEAGLKDATADQVAREVLRQHCMVLAAMSGVLPRAPGDAAERDDVYLFPQIKLEQVPKDGGGVTTVPVCQKDNRWPLIGQVGDTRSVSTGNGTNVGSPFVALMCAATGQERSLNGNRISACCHFFMTAYWDVSMEERMRASYERRHTLAIEATYLRGELLKLYKEQALKERYPHMCAQYDLAAVQRGLHEHR